MNNAAVVFINCENKGMLTPHPPSPVKYFKA